MVTLAVFEILSQISTVVICIYRVLRGNEIFQYLRNYKHHEVNQGFRESSYRVLQATSKWKALKQLVYFLRSVEVLPTFAIQIDITLAISWEKMQNYTL